jgi:hypothetical protein
MTFPAQAQVAAWSAADGPVLILGRMAAWRAERGLRVSGPWAIFGFGLLRGLAHGVKCVRAGRGLFSYSGQILVVNSNLSQFIFCSEIV